MGQKAISRRLWRVIVGRLAIVFGVLLILVLVAPSLSFIEVRALDLMYGLRSPRPPSSRRINALLGDNE